MANVSLKAGESGRVFRRATPGSTVGSVAFTVDAVI
tara:strand:- start:11480 stop:11587 length:108 start_codon:yes stop_codon:yes gene_type:complete